MKRVFHNSVYFERQIFALFFLRPIKAIFKEFQDCEPLCIHNYHKFVLRCILTLKCYVMIFLPIIKTIYQKKNIKKIPSINDKISCVLYNLTHSPADKWP